MGPGDWLPKDPRDQCIIRDPFDMVIIRGLGRAISRLPWVLWESGNAQQLLVLRNCRWEASGRHQESKRNAASGHKLPLSDKEWGEMGLGPTGPTTNCDCGNTTR